LEGYQNTIFKKNSSHLTEFLLKGGAKKEAVCANPSRGWRRQALELLGNEPGAGSGLLQAEDSSLWGAHRAAGSGLPYPAPPPRPRFVYRQLQGQYARPGTVSHEHLSSGTVANEHLSFFFPDNGHGSANAAGFGWRNGG
jgi:hypothetical protein